jgi:hypothetical protein
LKPWDSYRPLLANFFNLDSFDEFEQHRILNAIPGCMVRRMRNVVVSDISASLPLTLGFGLLRAATRAIPSRVSDQHFWYRVYASDCGRTQHPGRYTQSSALPTRNVIIRAGVSTPHGPHAILSLSRQRTVRQQATRLEASGDLDNTFGRQGNVVGMARAGTYWYHHDCTRFTSRLRSSSRRPDMGWWLVFWRS